MEILNTLLLLFVLVLLWILPIVLGLKLAKRNKVSAFWMLFGISPGLAWLGYIIIRLNGRVDQVGNVTIQWITGKVKCPSCGEFNSMNKNFCPICTAPTFKPSCPRCESSKTRFVGHVGHNFWLAILFFSIGGVIINGSENIRSGRGIFTNEDLLILLFAVPIFLASLVFFFKPLSRDVKRVLCQSCNTESFIADIHAFQQSIYGQDTPVNLTTLIQAAFDKNTGTGENSPEPTGAIQRYLANGYDLISETKNTENNITTEKTPELNEKPPNKVIMERRSPINPIMMLAWVIMFWPIAIYYAIPEKRKLYRVQLEITDDGQLVESGGTIEQLEKDKKRARKTGWILLGISIPVFICIITIGLSGGFDAN